MTDQPALDETPESSPEPAQTPASSGECDECHGHVATGTYCAGCGLQGRLEPEYLSFTMPIEMPFDVPRPDCCPGYKVLIEAHEDDQYGAELMTYSATYTHRATCDVWRYL